MIRGRNGVLTGRGTFQKFFEQNDLKTYLETQLQTEAIPAGIGTFYLFKDEGRRQQFLANRFRCIPIVPRRRRSTRERPPSTIAKSIRHQPACMIATCILRGSE